MKTRELPKTPGTTPTTVHAYGAASADAPMAPLTIPRRAPTERDVQIEILYCGICHSDLHQVRDEWAEFMPTVYPCVPGHEIVGRVTAVGSAVTKHAPGAASAADSPAASSAPTAPARSASATSRTSARNPCSPTTDRTRTARPR